MFSDFPNLHPLVVHFPIVLILLSAALQVILVFKDTPSLRWGTGILMGLAFASALVASKVFHAHPAALPAGANTIFLEHEKYAAYTLWISGLAFVLRGIGNYYQIHRRSYETLVLVSALVSAVFLSLAGHRGAQLVYVEGVGPKGHLVVTEGQDHSGHAAGLPPLKAGEDREHAVHPGGHDDSMSHSPSFQGRQAKELMDHQGHAASSHPDASQVTHPMPKRGHSRSHPAAGKSAHKRMAGMDHGPIKASPNKKNLADHAAMGHGNTHPPAHQPAAPRQTGLDQEARQATGGHQQTGHAPGQSTRTDAYGRPLIDLAEPYDNNPAREQAQSQPKRD